MKTDFTKNLSQIGGRWAISFRVGLAIFPFYVLSIPTIEANFHDSENFLRWTWVSLIASVPAGILLYLAHLTYFRNRVSEPRPAYTVFILGFFVGAIKGALVEGLALNAGLTSGNALIQISIRAINSAVLSAIMIPLLALLLVTVNNFKIQKRELLEQLAFVRSKNSQIAKLDSRIEQVTPDQLRDQINGLLSQTKEEFLSERHSPNFRPEIIVELLNRTAEEVIRPLSHSLYQKSLIRLPKLSAIQFIKALSGQFQIEIRAIVIFYILFSFKNLYVLFGFGEAIFLLVWRTLLLALILWIFKSLFSLSKKEGRNPFILAAILSTTAFVCIESTISTSLGYPTDLAKIILSIAWNLIVVFITGIIIAISNLNRSQLDSLKLQIKDEEVAAYSKALEQRYLYCTHSKILHGVYHSRLVACAVAISTAVKADNPEDLEFELDRASDLLKIDFESHMVEMHEDVASILEELEAKWAGTLGLTILNRSSNGISGYQLLALNEFLSEAFTNAFRHGRASNACVEIDLDSNLELHVKVEDDGVGYIPSTPGLGSAIFSELSHSKWAIKSREDNSGAIVTIVIPTEEIK